LAIALAIASSFRDAPVDPEMAAMGEVGLSGEIRAVPQLERRLNEVARLGFKRAIVPRTGARNLRVDGLELVPVSTLREAINKGLGEKRHPEEELPE
jgi:DNA repair protein RadA/Sms